MNISAAITRSRGEEERLGRARARRMRAPLAPPPGRPDPLIGRRERAPARARPTAARTCSGWKPAPPLAAFRGRKGRGRREGRAPPAPPHPRLGPAGAGWASWARWLGPGWRRPEVAASPAPRPGAGGDRSERPRSLMRLLVGWLCLSLASVWLARRMWTLRSPLTRSLYVNMTSGPGGPAAAAGGRKENHQVRAAGGGVAAGLPALGRRRGGGGPRPLAKFSGPGARPGPRGAFCSRRGDRGLPCPRRGRSVGAPEPALFPRPRRWLQTLGPLGVRARRRDRGTWGPVGTRLAPGLGERRPGAARYPAHAPCPRKAGPSFCLVESAIIQRVIKKCDRAPPATQLSGLLQVTFPRSI